MHSLDVKSIRLHRMPVSLERLGAFVQAEMDKHGWKDRQVSERSGGEISPQTVYNIRTATRIKEVLSETFIALGKGLGIQAKELFAVYIGEEAADSDAYKGSLFAEMYTVCEALPDDIKKTYLRTFGDMKRAMEDIVKERQADRA